METQVEADLDAYIPEIYIESDTERLDIYRRIYRTTKEHEVDDIRLELIDRYGALMEEAENLFVLAKLRVAASLAGFRKIELNKRSLRIYLPAEDDKQFYEGGAFQQLMEQVPAVENVNLKQEGKNLFLQTFVKSYEGTVRADESIGIIQKLHK